MTGRARVRPAGAVHPVAWWLWATGMAVAAMRTTNPFLLALIGAVVGFVVASRRGDAPWARSLSFFLRVGVAVIVIRVVVEVVLGQGTPGTVLFRLPRLPVPVGEGISLGGPVTAEALLVALVGGLRLAVIILCFGAANSLASPHRLLRALPAVLYEAGVVVTVALSFAPELVHTLAAVRRARALRGRPTRGPAGLRGLAVPVLEGALDRSIALAASMDARGYGRRPPGGRRRWPAWAVLAGLLVLCAGLYGVLVPSSLYGVGLPLVAAGSALLVAGLLGGGRRRARSRYRPDPWRATEWAVAGSGLATLAVFAVAAAAGVTGLAVGFPPLQVPPLPLWPAAGVLAALLPLAVTAAPSRVSAEPAPAPGVAPAPAVAPLDAPVGSG